MTDTKIQRLNSLSYQLCKFKESYYDVFSDNLGLLMQMVELQNTVNELIDKENSQ